MSEEAGPRCRVVADDDGLLAKALAGAGLLLSDEAPDVVIVAGGFDAVREAVRTGVRVVALTEQPERRTVAVLLDLGAAGVGGVSSPPDVIAALVRTVVAGYTVIPEAARQTVRRPALSTRQKQVLSLVVLGMNNAEIAERLFLSEATVKSHLTKIFSELGVRSRKQAVDLIHDPTSGLGPGILGIPQASRLQQGYGRPKFGD